MSRLLWGNITVLSGMFMTFALMPLMAQVAGVVGVGVWLVGGISASVIVSDLMKKGA